MATNIRVMAQQALDLYYQEISPNDAFFDLESFMFQCAITYTDLLNNEYQILKEANKRESGYSNIELSSSWLIEEKVNIVYNEDKEKWVAYMSYPIFSFKWDATGNSLQGIRPLKGRNIYRKISLNEPRFEHILPVTSFIYYTLCNSKEVEFSCEPCDKELWVKYVPALVGNDDNCVVADAMVEPVIEKVLTVMFGARNGTTIQMADDGNKNLIQPQQANNDLKTVGR